MKIKVLLVLLTLCAGVALAAATKMSVQVQKCVVRAKPNAMGKQIVTLAYGDRIDVGPLENGWYPVTVNGASGWVPESSLCTKKIVMSSGTGDAATGASSEEVAMAGKGFNKQVEDEMQAQGKLDYAWVKKMYDFTAKESDVALFRAQGNLVGGGQ